MNFLEIEELNTHLYAEISEEITRENDDIVQEAIDTAIDEARGYLTKYDIQKVFNPDTLEERHKKLLSVVKDIAIWHVIILGNPNIEVAIREKRYNASIEWLAKVQKGFIDPLLPLPAPNPPLNAGSINGEIKWSSNPKNYNQY